MVNMTVAECKIVIVRPRRVLSSEGTARVQKQKKNNLTCYFEWWTDFEKKIPILHACGVLLPIRIRNGSFKMSGIVI